MIRRRHALGLTLGLPALIGSARAQAFPDRPLSMIVPFPPGGQADLAARPIAAAMERLLGRPVVVVNRGGAGGAVGNRAAAQSAPDGYTLLMTLSSLAVLPEADRLFGRPPTYEVSQLEPVGRVLADPTLLAVPFNAPWRDLDALIADARSRPATIPYGSSGTYGTLHVAMEMFAHSAGIRLLHVPYQGAGPAVTAILAGTVQALASAPGVLLGHVRERRLRVLANWGAERIASFPDTPTFRELGHPSVEFYIWAGLFAPAGVPRPVMEVLRSALRKACEDPETVRVFAGAGSPVAYQDAPEFARFVEQDSARLIAAVRAIGRVE
ncbi:Bug family tripartite tricarboxylate transporter substrate binding protein [Elioraea sp.]|uniref:Bug family tripartite tricarboxylate transporter substrate binding protein n=1 Tax=Elioraea sp. TaxID=2185103 RepID=UPI003F70B869